MSGVDHGDNIADKILTRLKDLNDTLEKEIDNTAKLLTELYTAINKTKADGEEKEQLTQQLNTLTEQLEAVKKQSEKAKEDNVKLTEQLSKLEEINTQVLTLEKGVKTLAKNNADLKTDLETTYPTTSGGFQYNKKHLKYKGQSRSLHSNSKTTSRKRKKGRRRPGKGVKKGGMKTRRRRRNKKSKKSKKRRK